MARQPLRRRSRLATCGLCNPTWANGAASPADWQWHCQAQFQGIAYCPHWLAGGWAEVGANPDPLREQVFPLTVVDGWATLSDAPVLGVEPDQQAMAGYRVSGGGGDLETV